MNRPALVFALLLAGCGAAYDTPTHPVTYPTPTLSPTAVHIDKPIRSVTPGVVITREAADVCTPGWATAHRESLTVTEKRGVLTLYGLPTSWAENARHVSEWDHLVSLQLGGGNGTENIWPQTDHTQDQRKDRLETKLHTAVCHHTLTLTQAQRRIRAFWRYW